MANKLTLGIPTLNRSSLVSRLAERCLSQTEAPYEVIISDDASEDDTIENLTRFESPNLKIISRKERLGMINNWNACLEACTGDWFMLLSDDDDIAIDFVEYVRQAVEKSPDIDLLIIRARVVDQITSEVNENYPPVETTGEVVFANDILPAWLSYSFALPFVSMVFNVRTLRAQGGFSKKLPYAADVATWLPIAMHGRCYFLPIAKVDCIVHRSMATTKYKIETLVDDVVQLTAMVKEEFRKTGQTDIVKIQKINALADIYLRNIFGHVMIAAARSGSSKRDLASTWLKYLTVLPRFGIGPMSLGAVFVPQSLIQAVGWPYRRWVSWTRNKRTIQFLTS